MTAHTHRIHARMLPAEVQAVLARRRSNASGVHGRRRPDRGTMKRRAITRALREG